jgi:thioredoxin-like negative regulator of GroEL
MNNNGRGLVALAGALAITTVLAATPASAAPGECETELDAVATAIDDATFLSNRAAMDETNMEAKLAAAEAKVAQDKYSDAIDKLLNISDKATALANAGKPKLDDAAGINSAVTAAITCIGLL